MKPNWIIKRKAELLRFYLKIFYFTPVSNTSQLRCSMHWRFHFVKWKAMALTMSVEISLEQHWNRNFSFRDTGRIFCYSDVFHFNEKFLSQQSAEPRFKSSRLFK